VSNATALGIAREVSDMNRLRLSQATVATSLFLLVALSAGSAVPKGGEARDSMTEKLFDADPAHPWNRLHQLFYVRQVAKGRTYTHHGPDAPFGRHGPFLIEGPSHARVLKALDAFLRGKDDERIEDPLKRAMLQRDLWYVFDKLAETPSFGWNDDPIEDKQSQRRAVQKRLAQVMRHLEQSATRLKALPDNYAVAVESGAFPTKFDPKNPKISYLPADLRVDGKGDWVLVSRPDRGRGTGLAAPAHAKFVEGKAIFLSFLRLPGGRKATENYIARLPSPPCPDKDFPPLPDGTQMALVRRMLLPDDLGRLQATPVTENVQFRIFPKNDEQHFFEFTLDRAGLLSGRGGLRPVGPDDGDYFGFGGGYGRGDPFAGKELPQPRPILLDCKGCHMPKALFSINTFGFNLIEGYQGAARTDFVAQLRDTVDLKKSYSWGLLQGLRETTP
jgi:hypothetical protein